MEIKNVMKNLGVIGIASGAVALAAKKIINSVSDDKARLRLEEALEGLPETDLEFILKLDRAKLLEWVNLPKQLRPVQLKKMRNEERADEMRFEGAKVDLLTKTLSYMADNDGKVITLEEQISTTESLFNPERLKNREDWDSLSKNEQNKLIEEVLGMREKAIERLKKEYKPIDIKVFQSNADRDEYNKLQDTEKKAFIKQFVESTIKDKK